MTTLHETRTIWRWSQGEPLAQDHDDLAVEEPLEIRVRGRAISITMRTPGHDDELAAGFLLSEGLIHATEDVRRIDPCARAKDGGVVNVYLAGHVEVDFAKLTRHVFASSSCGLCGKASIEAVHMQFDPIHTNLHVDSETLLSLPDTLRSAQDTFSKTGGLHAAALFNPQGELLVLREDVGRHNAVDKVLGHALLHNWLPLDQHILMVSGRTSFEIMQKALAGRLAMVAAVSAPSSLAAEFAHDSNQTLVGFLRDQRMNIYTHPHRITFDTPAKP